MTTWPSDKFVRLGMTQSSARHKNVNELFPIVQLYVPLVIGRSGRALRLNVTCLEESGELSVYEVCSIVMTNQQARKNQVGSCSCCPMHICRKGRSFYSCGLLVKALRRTVETCAKPLKSWQWRVFWKSRRWFCWLKFNQATVKRRRTSS